MRTWMYLCYPGVRVFSIRMCGCYLSGCAGVLYAGVRVLSTWCAGVLYPGVRVFSIRVCGCLGIDHLECEPCFGFYVFRTGYWAWLLRNMGVQVAAYDIHPTNESEQNGHHALEMGKPGKSNAPPFTAGAFLFSCFGVPV
jgi:hypothetical protein